MKIRTIEELANHALFEIEVNKYDGVLLAKNEPVFRKMSHKELNEKLKPYGLKCIIDDLNCCAYTHNREICKIDNVPFYPVSPDGHRLPTTK